MVRLESLTYGVREASGQAGKPDVRGASRAVGFRLPYCMGAGDALGYHPPRRTVFLDGPRDVGSNQAVCDAWIRIFSTLLSSNAADMGNLFVSIDGIDGAGKSTQIAMLADWLVRRGVDPIQVRDPGGTALGEAVREILLHRQEIPLGDRAEMLLYMASRAQLVDEVIRPALEAGRTVISDRYLLANVVYQAANGTLDRLESRGIEFMRRVRNGFLEQAQHLPQGNCVVIDATQSIEQIHAAVVQAVEKALANASMPGPKDSLG